VTIRIPYERRAIERRVKCTGPVIVQAAPGSGPVILGGYWEDPAES
jgi:hypothetical protein